MTGPTRAFRNSLHSAKGASSANPLSLERGSRVSPAEQARILFDVDGNLFRYHRRFEGLVRGIAEHKLKRVFTRGQFNTCLRLSAPEMKMFFVLRNCIVR